MSKIARITLARPWIAFLALVFPVPVTAQADYPPAIVTTSLLNLRFYPTGKLMADRLQIVFPPKTIEKAEFSIAKAGGAKIATVPLRVERWPQFPVFDGFRPNGSPGIVDLGEAGDYVMSVRVNGREIGRLPFALRALPGADPFQPGKRFTREGPWKSLGFLSVETEKPDRALAFNWWTRTAEIGATSRTAKCTVHVFRGDEEIARSRSPVVVSRPDWQFVRTALRQPREAGGRNFTLAMLTGEDGDCSIVVKGDGKEVKRFRARVVDGRLQRLDECRLDHKPRTGFISPRLIDTSSGSGSRYKMLDAYWVRP
jgi:hypothetical protein